jgi:hypothetical protein
MAEDKVTIRMDRSSWNQITDDLGNYWGLDPDVTEVFESVEVLEPVDTAPHIAALGNAGSTEPERRARARRDASAIAAQLERDIAQDEQLRELLSYCRNLREHFIGGTNEAKGYAYAHGDVADKLAAILDGES